MHKQTYWAGVTDPGSLADCLEHTFATVRGGLTYSADLAEIRGQGALSRDLRHLHDAWHSSFEEWQRRMVTESQKRHPSDVAAEMASSCVSAAREGRLSESEFLANWTLSNFAKKFRYGCLMSDLEAKRGFLDRNAACFNNLRWDIRLRMKDLLSRALPLVSEEEGRFGPGATLERANMWSEKIAYCARLRGVSGRFVWEPQALGVAPPYAKLHAVPKDFKRKRLITVEPLVVAWHQQAARSTILQSVHHGALRGTVMDQALSQTYETEGGVTLSSARSVDPVLRQRDRCRRGASDGSLATIDLSDASDSISWDAVSSTFPAWVLMLLEKCRSPAVIDGGVTHELRMYAGMGNATTFIVETLFFWALFTAVGEAAHVGKPSVTVFGDDIVMNGKVARHPWFTSMIRDCGLKVNWEKCGLSAGPGFREACGLVVYKSCELPFTPRFYGYAGTKEGAAQYCELSSRLLCSDLPLFKLLGLGLITWSGAPKAPYLTARESSETGACVAYFIEEGTGTLPGLRSLLRIHSGSQSDVTTRYNSRLQRREAYLWVVRSKTSPITLRDPKWGPGVSRSWGWWAYQLALLGQTAYDVQIRRKSRLIRCAIAHRTTVRRRWVPIGFLSR